MNKQYLELTLESDTFKNLKADFNELLQQLLEKLHQGKIAEGSIMVKLNVSLSEAFSPELGEDITVPLFKHKTKANYTEVLENAGAVSLPNTYLEYDPDLGAFVLKPLVGEKNLFEDAADGTANAAAIDVKAIPADTSGPLQLRDPMCNDCPCWDPSACDHCEGCDKWEPIVK